MNRTIRSVVLAALLLSLQACGDDDDDGGAGSGGTAGTAAGTGTAGTGTAGTGTAGTSTAGTGTAGTGTAGTSSEDDAGMSDASIDAGLDASIDAAVDGGTTEAPPQLNGCTTYVDRTGASDDRELTWGLSIENDPERCIKILAGQSVDFDGNKVTHPIEADGGDSPTPFTSQANSYAFPNAGAFGFVCGVHPQMTGVVWVVP